MMKQGGSGPQANLRALGKGLLLLWLALALGCVLTITLYSGMVWAGPRFGLKL